MTQSFDPAVPPAQPPTPDRSLEMQQRQAEVADLNRRMKSGANNFYWIAALSVINSLLLQFGGDIYFVVGLAGTLFVDIVFVGIAETMPEAALVVKIIGVIISAVLAGIFALFGFFANSGKRWAFLVGIAFYIIDSILMLVFQEWMGLLFHALFLFGLFSGLNALNKLQKLTPPKPSSPSDFPQNIGTP